MQDTTLQHSLLCAGLTLHVLHTRAPKSIRSGNSTRWASSSQITELSTVESAISRLFDVHPNSRCIYIRQSRRETSQGTKSTCFPNHQAKPAFANEIRPLWMIYEHLQWMAEARREETLNQALGLVLDLSK